MDKWQLDTIYRMYKGGKSQREIAHAIQASITTVNKYCKEIRRQESTHTKPASGDLIPQLRAIQVDLSQTPTLETVKTDILTVYRQTLYELQQRMTEMSTNEIYTLSMTLLKELNGGNTES